MHPKRNVLVTLGWYDPRFLEGVGRFAREANWHLATRSLIEASTPIGWKGDGMLVNDSEVPRLASFLRSQLGKQPTVLMGSNHKQLSLPTVEEDNAECGRLAAEHFLDRGYRNFAWFSIARGRVEQERREAFVRRLAAAGQECILLEWERARGRRSDKWSNCRRWLEQRVKTLPTPLAVFVLDDLLAADVIEVCLDSGLRVPEDVAVMGVGNMELACECCRVPISSVDLDLVEIAYRSARLLDDLMNGEPAPTAPIRIAVRGVILRKSTDALAVTAGVVAQAIAFIKANFQTNIGVDDMARAVGISRRSLHEAFQRDLRRTPAKHLLRLRLEHAIGLLRATDDTIPAIAEACGFGSSRNLHRCFLRETRLSPRAFVSDSPAATWRSI